MRPQKEIIKILSLALNVKITIKTPVFLSVKCSDVFALARKDAFFSISRKHDS